MWHASLVSMEEAACKEGANIPRASGSLLLLLIQHLLPARCVSIRRADLV